MVDLPIHPPAKDQETGVCHPIRDPDRHYFLDFRGNHGKVEPTEGDMGRTLPLLGGNDSDVRRLYRIIHIPFPQTES